MSAEVADGEKSSAYDPFRNPDASGVVGPDDAPPGDDDAPADADDAPMLENSASGAAGMSNPLSNPNSRAASRLSGDEEAGDAAAIADPDKSASAAAPASLPPVQRKASDAPPPLPRGGTAVGGALKRGDSMMGSMRRTSSANMKQRRQSQAQATGTLTKRNTLASMMLSGKFEQDAQDPIAGGGQSSSAAFGAHVAEESGAYTDPEGEEEEEEYGGTAEEMKSEQIFMPNMRREPFIPVRIARDKLKQVLKEMAQMKHMHYAALETMERQQEFLKAQLEATVATYARKLTADYNQRVKALEAEYERRLEGLNKTAMGDLQATLEAAQRESKNLEAKLELQMQEQDREVQQERNMFNQKVQMARQSAEEAEKLADDLKKQLKDREDEVEKLEVEVRVARASAGDTLSGGGAAEEIFRTRIESLEKEVANLQRDRDQLAEDRTAFEAAVDERDQEIAALQDQLARLAEATPGGGDLIVAGGDDEEEEEGGVVVAGDDDDEDEEEGGIEIVGDD